MAQGNFEAKKHAYRQTQDGVVISFVVHPNDVSAEMATAALGTRYMIGFAEIGDDGKPIAPAKPTPSAPKEKTERRKFDTLPLSQQAALRCNDKRFQKWLDCETDEQVADAVRSECKVTSRSKILPDTSAGAVWQEINRRFESWLVQEQYADSVR